MADDQARAVQAGFGRLAVAVAIITTLDNGRPHGCTGMAWAEHATLPLLLTTLRSGGRPVIHYDGHLWGLREADG